MKAKIILTVIMGSQLVFGVLRCAAQNIGINNTGAAPDSSAILDVNAPNKGMLIPRLSDSQRNAIASPAAGLFIYDTSVNKVDYWNGSEWIQLSNSAIAATNGSGTSTGRSIAISNTNSPANPSAMLDIQSATGGLLIPRMSGTQRDAIPSPIAGLIIYNTTTGLLNYFSTGGWQQVCGTVISSTTGAVTTPSNIGINTATPDPSAMLDVSSITAGMAIPRLTSAQRDAIPSPAQGLMLYNTSTQAINVYDGTGNWLIINSQAIPTVPVAATITPTPTQITWSWTSVTGASGYKYNTLNNYNTATDNGADTAYIQTGLVCNTADTLFVWAYNCSGNSTAATLTQTTSACSSCSNAWNQEANYGGGGTDGGTGFSIGGYGYILSGMSNAFWQWDQATNTWTQMKNFPGANREFAVGFSIGAKGYIGTGWPNGGTPFNDFWEWDQATNTWTQKANFPGTPRYLAVGFSIGAEGYIGTGGNNPGYDNDFWQWDQATNTWTQQANFGGAPRYGATGFSIGTKGYIGTGIINGAPSSDFWEWDQASNTWTQKAPFGGGTRADAVGFSIGAEGYIGIGDNGAGTLYSDFWQWDQASNTWTDEANFGGGIRDGSIGFSVGSYGYIGTGWNNSSNQQDYWQYCPTVSICANGTIGWQQVSNPDPNQDFAGGIALNGTGVYISGFDNIAGGNSFEWRIEKRDLGTGDFISAFGTGGVVESNPTYAVQGQHVPMAIDASGIYVVGMTVPYYNYLHIEKRDLTTGALINTYGTGGAITEILPSADITVSSVAIDTTGLYIFGYDDVTGVARWRVEKRDLSTGALINGFGTSGVITSPWTSPGDISGGITVDSSGIYLVGYDYLSNTNLEWRIEKRNLTTGALITTFGANGVIQEDPATGSNYATCVTNDASGIYLYGIDALNGYEMRVEKRDLTTGALINSFGTGGVITSDPGEGDYANGIETDGTGIYLIGGDDAPGNTQWRIEKRNLTTGALITSFGTGGVLLTNPTPGNDYTTAGCRLDNSGMYVAGYQDGNNDSAWKIIKYCK